MSACVKISRQQLAMLSARLNHRYIKSRNEMLRGMSQQSQTEDKPINRTATFCPYTLQQACTAHVTEIGDYSTICVLKLHRGSFKMTMFYFGEIKLISRAPQQIL